MKFYVPILSTVEKAAQAGLVEVGELVLQRSNDGAPVDTNELRESGFVDADDLQVKVGYDHPKGYPYIRRQHEDLDYQHTTGGPKFLEKAEEATRAEVPAIVAKHIRGALGG